MSNFGAIFESASLIRMEQTVTKLSECPFSVEIDFGDRLVVYPLLKITRMEKLFIFLVPVTVRFIHWCEDLLLTYA